MSPEKLVEDLRKDLAAGRVLVVVGAGVSLQASGNDRRAGWSGLIHDGIDYCASIGSFTKDDATALHERLEKNKHDRDALLEIAESIRTHLNDGEFRRWLQESVGTLPLNDREIVDAIHSLESKIATTNYDDLLKRGRPIDAVPWTDLALVHELIRGDRKGILHFHGYYDVPSSVILGFKSYEEILGAKSAQVIQQVLAARDTLLFVGCGDGLADPNFGALLQWYETVFGGSKYRHYFLCRTGEAQALRTSRSTLSFIEYGSDYKDLAPALRELAPPRPAASNLPSAGYCFGRETEVKALVSELSKKKPSPIPILGGPGMGKTTIALKAIAHNSIVKRLGARRWFVRCDGVKTRAELAAAIARALGLNIGPNVELAVLAELSNGRGALVLDNAETPLDADKTEVEELLSILASVDSLALVATIRGKHRPPTVAWGPTIEVERLSDEAAHKAFVAASGKKTYVQDGSLSQVLSVLDGIPLAIVLMGRFAESFKSLDLVWERWRARKTAILSSGSSRLTNIEITYELSIEVLTSDARRLLSVLALLPDGVADADLPAIFVDPERAADELRNRALVEHEEKRLRMLAPLREYTAKAYPPYTADQVRAVRHYITLAAQEGTRVGYAGGAEAVARLAPEVANMEVMLAQLMTDSPDGLAQAVGGWARFMRFTGLGSTKAIETVKDQAQADDFKLAVQCLKSLGEIALHRSDYDTASDCLQQALPLYRRIGDLRGEADCIKSLGTIALRRSDYDTAGDRYQEAVQLFRRVGDLLGEANCIGSLGDIAVERSELDTARDRYQEALPLFRRLGDLLGEANCTRRVGDIMSLERSELDTARDRYQEALLLYCKVGDVLGEANCIRQLGNIAFERSDFDTARDRYQEALPLFRKVGDVRGEADCIESVGDIARERGNVGEAESRYREALTLFRRMKEPCSIGETHRRLARLADDAGARKTHLAAAREAWISIKRDDLVAGLDAEFASE